MLMFFCFRAPCGIFQPIQQNESEAPLPVAERGRNLPSGILPDTRRQPALNHNCVHSPERRTNAPN